MLRITVTKHKYSRLNQKAAVCIFADRRLDYVEPCCLSAKPSAKLLSLAVRLLLISRDDGYCLL